MGADGQGRGASRRSERRLNRSPARKRSPATVMPRLSFEFYPPQTDRGRTNLVRTAERLGVLGPAFYSVTYGAGGSTRDRTFAAVERLRTAGLPTTPHLSWGDDDEQRILALIDAYQKLGVRRLVTLRGDVPSGTGAGSALHHAEELVRFIRERVAAPFELFVAAYPEVHPDAATADSDIEFLKRKVDAGANGCITQYFYNADAYFYFRDRCVAAGIGVPIVPGVMPITNYAKLARFSDKAGAEIPRWIRKRLEGFDDASEALVAFGTDVVSALCERLLHGGAPGMHFYTLNRAAPTLAIARNLGLAQRPDRAASPHG